MQFRQTAAKIEPAGESEPVRVDINSEGTKTSAEPICCSYSIVFTETID